jgi:hypothetical protein
MRPEELRTCPFLGMLPRVTGFMAETAILKAVMCGLPVCHIDLLERA